MISESGHNQIRKGARPPAPPRSVAPKSTKSTQTAQPKDLVEITGGTTGSAVKAAAKSAGRFLLKTALPLVGTAVAGVPGLIAGAALSGAATYFTERSAGESGKPWGPLMTSALAGATNLAGPVGPFIAAGLAGTGALVSGALEGGTALREPDFEVNLTKLARRYHSAVADKLQEQGHSVEKLAKPPGMSLSSVAAKRKAQIHIAKTALLASHHLGPAAAMAIAGELGRDGVDSKAVEPLSKRASELIKDSREEVDGHQVQFVTGLKARERSDAIASYDSVYVDAEYQDKKGQAKTDFLLGHEFSHLENNDSGATQVQNVVIDAVRAVKRMSGSDQEVMDLNELDDGLSEAQLAQSRSIEYRSDDDGLKYALGKGHAKSDIIEGAKELFSGENGDEEKYRAHPDADKRINALQSSEHS